MNSGSSSGGTSANIFAALSPMTKQVYPNPSNRRKRFAKIRKQIKGEL